jgi:hypothetical protein
LVFDCFFKRTTNKELNKAATNINELRKQILLNQLKKNTLSSKTYKISYSQFNIGLQHCNQNCKNTIINIIRVIIIKQTMKHIKLKILIITQNVEEIKLGGGGVLGEYLKCLIKYCLV